MTVLRVEKREGTPLRCALCHGELPGEDRVCNSCGTRAHIDCAEDLDRCPTIGCPDRIRVDSPTSRALRWGFRAINVLLFVLVGGAGLIGLREATRPPATTPAPAVPAPAAPAVPAPATPGPTTPAPTTAPSRGTRPLLAGTELRLGATASELATALGVRPHPCGRGCAECLEKGVDPAFDADGRLVSIRFYWNGAGLPNRAAADFAGELLGELGAQTDEESARTLLGEPTYEQVLFSTSGPLELAWRTPEGELTLTFSARTKTLVKAELRR